MDEIRSLSLVIPAFKQQKTISENIKIVDNTLSLLPYKYEIIIVVDGKIDKTSDIVRKIAKKNKRVVLYENKRNIGKGYSVKYGVEKAKGDIVGFMDAGLDIDPSSISVSLNYMNLHKADIIVGSKTHPDSVVDYPLYRKMISLAGRFVTQFLFGFSVLDTQVGLKFFRKKVAKDVFPRLLVKKFSFYIELLAVANVLGYKRIYEAPVKLSFKEGSISYNDLFWVLLKTFWDTLAIFYRIKILKFYRKSNRRNWIR